MTVREARPLIREALRRFVYPAVCGLGFTHERGQEVARVLGDQTVQTIYFVEEAGAFKGEVELRPMLLIENPRLAPIADEMTDPSSFDSRTAIVSVECARLAQYEERLSWTFGESDEVEAAIVHMSDYLVREVVPFLDQCTLEDIVVLIAQKDQRISSDEGAMLLGIAGALVLKRDDLVRALGDRLFGGLPGRRNRYPFAVACLQKRGWSWEGSDNGLRASSE